MAATGAAEEGGGGGGGGGPVRSPAPLPAPFRTRSELGAGLKEARRREPEARRLRGAEREVGRGRREPGPLARVPSSARPAGRGRGAE